MSDEELIEKARATRGNAHAPYSQFKVGAAILAKSGKVYTGANVENSSYGLTVCAERVALYCGVSQGEREFVKLALVSDREEPAIPCGACCQVLSEFNPDMEIICANLEGITKKITLKRLLPSFFRIESPPTGRGFKPEPNRDPEPSSG
jgi:cytidine deaminase